MKHPELPRNRKIVTRAPSCRVRVAMAVAIAGLLALPLGRPVLVASEPAPAGTLCVMTFNLRYASPTPPNSWPQRRPVMRDCIRKVAPDLLGTQEGLFAQLKDLAADLAEYDWIGLGRDGGSRGEFMAVFYRKERLEPLGFDHFWLSDTPDLVGSTTWGNSNRRMVTWVKFRDRATGGDFYFFNTHLDHEIQGAREKGATLIRQRVEALKTSLPVILAGDFNATAGANPAYTILVNPDAFSDLWSSATERRGEVVRTFHSFKGPVKGDNRIDWILGRGPVQADAAEIITFSENGQYPSDHFPVVVWLRLGKEARPE